MNEVALARWQGAVDERTKVIERRMDSLNGDVRTIRDDIAEIKTAVQASSEFRAGWGPMLEQLRLNTALTKQVKEQRQRGFSKWEKLASLIVAALLVALQAFQAIH